MPQPGFFDLDDRHAQLSKAGDPLVKLKQLVDFEIFRPLLGQLHEKPRKSNAGRKPWDVVLMFKVVLLQRLYPSISDDQMEFQIRDRLSFQRFLDLSLESAVPDAKTIWLFRDRINKAQLMGALFARFDQALSDIGYKAAGGQIIDATLVRVPISHQTREESEQIKRGETPDWPDLVKRQKDTDARWTRKYGQMSFGYKNHISVDVWHGFIRRYEVTSAQVHDSRMFEAVLDHDNRGRSVWADSAYRSKEREAQLRRQGFFSRIQKQGQARAPLTALWKALNNRRMRVRCRVEHVFARQRQLGQQAIRSIGLARAQLHIGLNNLAFNLTRLVTLRKAECTA